MRLRSLRLHPYGHFDDQSVEFGPCATVVVGPNEAGKSTLLDALGDFLWGIKAHRHRRAFEHAARALELVGYVDLDGEGRTYVRRLKRLIDGEGHEVVPPWDPSHTYDVAGWSMMFGLDLIHLQEGGKQVLAGKGDLASLIFLAETGRLVQGIREEIAERMNAIFRKHAGAGSKVKEALKAIDSLDKSIEVSEASAEDVTRLRKQISELTVEREDRHTRLLQSERELAHTQELQRCLPVVADLHELEGELAQLRDGGLVLNTSDTDALRSALEDSRTAKDKIADLEGRIEENELNLGELQLAPDLIAAAKDITSLMQSLEARSKDLAVISDDSELNAGEARIADLLRRLGKPPEENLEGAVMAAVLSDATRDRLSRLATDALDASARADAMAVKVAQAETKAKAQEPDSGGDQALLTARANRDLAWQAVRGPWLRGDLPAEEERARLADEVELTTVRADETAERMAEQLQAAAHARGEAEQRERQLNEAREELAAQTEASDELNAEWMQVAEACGLPSGVDAAAWKVHQSLIVELDDEWRGLCRKQQEQRDAQTRWDNFSAAVAALAALPGEAHDNPLRRVESLDETLTKARSAGAKAAQIQTLLRKDRKEVAENQRLLGRAQERISELVADSGEDPKELLARCDRVIAKELELEHKTAQLRAAKEPGSAIDALVDELRTVDAVELKERIPAVQAEKDDLQDAISALDSDLGVAQNALADLESRDSAAGLRADQVAEGEKLRALVHEYRSLRLQVAMLDEFLDDLAKSGDFPLLTEAGRYLALLTNDRYTGFEVVEDGDSRHIDVVLGAKDSGETRMELEELSVGTADQVFLSLRLAGIRARQQDRIRAGLPVLPVVLDDVLVDHDDERARAALELVAEIAAEMQIIVLTHHGVVGQMAEAIEGIERVDLGA